MLFNSLSFLVFLPVVFTLYWSLFSRKLKWRNFFLLTISYVFYGWWDWRYLFLIAGCSFVNWVAALQIRRSVKLKHPNMKRCWLVLACILSLCSLVICKYYNFFVESFVEFCKLLGVQLSIVPLKVILPVGISFFTFQALSYTIDVYRGKLMPTRRWIDFFAFISFFPQLVAGPIERATSLLPQFRRKIFFDYDNAILGLTLIAYGLFKKMVVADNLAIYVDYAFKNYFHYNSITSILGVLFFSFQIYCDFSGYSDIARGVSKLFGFELMINFDRPYQSKSIMEFWRRWHISLSTWFKDYLYIPLGGSRVSTAKWIRNIWIVFLVSGLWHGANWTFIVWGALHAFYQICGYFKSKWLEKRSITLPASRMLKYGVGLLQILFVNVLVFSAWIFFRADSLSHAWEYLKSIVHWKGYTTLSALCAGQGPVHLLLCFFVMGILILVDLLPRDFSFSKKRKLLFICAMLLLIIFLSKGGDSVFIYFQF